jgi:PAS domain S-box-containing protein
MRRQRFPDILPQKTQSRVASLLSTLSPELLWQLALEQLDIAIVIKHANGEMIYANQRFCDLIECSKEDIIGRKIEEVLPQKNYEQQKALLEKEREKRLSGKSGVYDLELEVASGKTKTVRIHASPIFDCDKNYLGSIGIVTDVSRETTALKAVSNAEALLAAVFHVANVGLCITDSEGKVIAANPAHSKIDGYTQEELVGELFTKVLPPELREDALKLHHEYMAGEWDNISGEWQVLHKNGTRRDVAVSVARLILDDGRKFRVSVLTDLTEQKLIERQLRYQAQLLENVSDAVIAIDNDYRITSWNTAAEKLYGWTAAEVLGKHLYHILSYKYLNGESEETIAETALKTGKWVGEVLDRRKDGTEVIVEACVSYLRNEKGEIIGAVCIKRDVTEQKQIERQLRYQAQLLENVSDAVMAVDNDYIITSWNRAAEKLYGWTATEVLGKHLFEVTQYRHLNGESEETLKEALLKAGKWIGEFLEKRKDGTEIIVEACISQLRNEKGEIIGAVGIKRDVTEQKQIERQLRYQAQLLENVSDAVIAVDNNHIITSWNAAAEKLYGWTATEVLGKNIYRVLPTTYLNGASEQDAIKAMQATGKWVGEVVQKRKDGTEMIVEACVSYLRNEKGNIIGMVSINRDITEQKRYAEERQRLYEQLQHLQKMESIGRLAGGVAHDFNNILAAILGNVKMATEKTTDEKVTKYLSRIKAASERASALTQQLLGFARQGKYVPAPVDLFDCVRNVVEMLEHTIDKRIEVVVEPASMPTKVIGDRTQLEQVILNIAINAVDAIMPTLEEKQHGVLRFAWRSGVREDIKATNPHLLTSQPYFCLAISDSGIGIPKEIQKKIFEPFFTTKEIGKGTGLGLAMVYGIMQNHHGAVYVESEVGRGATFELYFPQVLESQTENGVKETYINQKLMSNKRVLIVDDEDMLRELLTEQLTEAGYAVCEASNGVEAIEVLKRLQAEQVRVDAVVLDMNMPKMDGAKAFAEIRALFPRMPILIATGYAQDEMVQKVVESGANGVLVKPYDAEALFEKLNEILKVRA